MYIIYTYITYILLYTPHTPRLLEILQGIASFSEIDLKFYIFPNASLLIPER